MTAPRTHGVRIYLDGGATPIAEFDPPSVFSLDTEQLADGPHTLRIEAIDECAHRSERLIPFEVRNGPGIAVEGIAPGETVGGRRSIVINAYAAGRVEAWEPVRAETPTPIPSWMWVVFLIMVAAGVFYVAREWQPPARYASTPTYAFWSGAAAAGVRPAITTGSDHGAELFRVTCANCHQANGDGVPGAFPPLAGDPIVTSSDPRQHAQIVLFGLAGRVIGGTHFTAQMPAWGGQLSDDEVAAIMNYERSAWGNTAPPTTAKFVSTVRAARVAATP
jgi:mono/diheme cytochrome c family protein